LNTTYLYITICYLYIDLYGVTRKTPEFHLFCNPGVTPERSPEVKDG
jgi:hypothetical protein